tara:strand:+ start:1885 stop:2082 length:198 start_codon:yes stop_codon:yes gene_type:complete
LRVGRFLAQRAIELLNGNYVRNYIVAILAWFIFRGEKRGVIAAQSARFCFALQTPNDGPVGGLLT